TLPPSRRWPQQPVATCAPLHPDFPSPSGRIPLPVRGYLFHSCDNSCSVGLLYQQAGNWQASRVPASLATGLSVLLLRPEDSVTRIAQPRNDVAVFIQVTVDRCRIDVHVRVILLDLGDALGRRHENQGAHIAAAGLLEQVDGGHHGTAGG